jgi:hypothetical protein
MRPNDSHDVVRDRVTIGFGESVDQAVPCAHELDLVVADPGSVEGENLNICLAFRLASAACRCSWVDTLGAAKITSSLIVRSAAAALPASVRQHCCAVAIITTAMEARCLNQT